MLGANASPMQMFAGARKYSGKTAEVSKNVAPIPGVIFCNFATL